MEWKGYKYSKSVHQVMERADEAIGAGRIVSKHILDKMNWEMFDIEKDTSLDFSQLMHVKMVGGDVKSITRDDIFNSDIDVISLECSFWSNKHSLEEDLELGTVELRHDYKDWLMSRFPEAFIFQDELVDHMTKLGIRG